MYLLYSALLALALLLGGPYWLFQMVRHGKYRNGFRERLGLVPDRIGNQSKPSIWIHAVSVGEVLAVSELVRGLQAEFPDHRVVVSTTTDTGQRLATARFGAENVFYFPFDFRFCVKRYFAALQPDLVVIAETELWPNLLRLSRESGTHVAVVNARISDRSLPGYRRWRALLAPVLKNVDLFLAQTSEDARRLAEIGAPADRVVVGGNLKFDVPSPPAPAIVGQIRSALGVPDAGPVLVCGSTLDGEERTLLEAFANMLANYPAAVMLLAPRHPERFELVAALIEQSKLKLWRRSTWNGEQLSGGVLLIDSIGELASLYALADIAFVGGSLVPRGGHSILEPAQHGVPILVGPHTENFRDIVALFQSRDAVRVATSANFSQTIMSLVADNNERRALGQRALETLHSQRGATQFTLDQLAASMKSNAREAHPA